MKLKSFIFIATLLVFFTACKSDKKVESEQQKSANSETSVGYKVIVEEVINTTTYTYLKVTLNETESWIAINKRKVEIGETLYYNEALEMKNFESKELKRTFETVYFVQNISDQPIPVMAQPHAKKMTGGKPKIQQEDISVSPAKGGITIAKLYSDSQSFSDKTVIVKGKVTKFNEEIMGKNWVHIQDGTSDADNFDLTITTSGKIKVGDIVTFKGKISLDKDFGYGYSYKVLMEDAEILKGQSI